MGCPCHIIHNTAQKASQAFCSVSDGTCSLISATLYIASNYSYKRAQITGFDVDDFLVDLYFYFDKSTKRKAELAGMV